MRGLSQLWLRNEFYGDLVSITSFVVVVVVVVVGPCLYFDSNKLVTKHNFCDYQGKLNMDRVLLELCNILPLWCRVQYSALGDCVKLVYA